ncbi:MAG TPA: hypothetical protein VFK38_07160 [Candidatus Limnocylindrales bacterium]|nr:hypothetical protein [Candidatus Limnocylindrales bacterium]
MDQQTAVTFVVAFAAIGVVAVAVIIMRRGREDAAATEADPPLAASSEGMTVCRKCGNSNLATDANCIYCGSPLPHSAFGGEARIR